MPTKYSTILSESVQLSFDHTDLQFQTRGCGHSKVKLANGKAWA